MTIILTVALAVALYLLARVAIKTGVMWMLWEAVRERIGLER